MDLNGWVKDSHERASEKGWWDNCIDDTGIYDPEDGIRADLVEKAIPEKLALIHSEVSEALEDYRNGAMHTGHPYGKPVGFPSELADIIIRVCDLAGALGIDLEAEVARKAAYNETRTYRHGGKRA